MFVCAFGGLTAHEMMSSLASPQDKAHDWAIIISVSCMTETKDICESNKTICKNLLDLFVLFSPDVILLNPPPPKKKRLKLRSNTNISLNFKRDSFILH